MAQEVSCRPLGAKNIRSVEVTRGRGFLRVLRFYPVTIHAASWNSSTYCSYQKDEWENSGNVPKSNILSEIVERWIDKFCRFCCQKYNII